MNADERAIHELLMSAHPARAPLAEAWAARIAAASEVEAKRVAERGHITSPWKSRHSQEAK